MSTREELRNKARSKAEEVLTRRKQQETERVSNRGKEIRALDEKIGRLRELRLAKEAADQAAAQTDPAPRKSRSASAASARARAELTPPESSN